MLFKVNYECLLSVRRKFKDAKIRVVRKNI